MEGLIWGTNLAFSCVDWGKPWKPQDSCSPGSSLNVGFPKYECCSCWSYMCTFSLTNFSALSFSFVVSQKVPPRSKFCFRAFRIFHQLFSLRVFKVPSTLLGLTLQCLRVDCDHISNFGFMTERANLLKQ